tara:strand:+ start:425 stop:796 length:372 start_codon:yes stop_codon:yes gene_type:complete
MNYFIFGISGSGKTTYAKALNNKHTNHVLYSTDNYIGRKQTLINLLNISLKHKIPVIVEGVNVVDVLEKIDPKYLVKSENVLLHLMPKQSSSKKGHQIQYKGKLTILDRIKDKITYKELHQND